MLRSAVSCVCMCSFHVGSGCQTPLAYLSALKLSSELFQHAASIGYHMTLLDIGGGFPGDKSSGQLFNKVATSINTGIETYFSRKAFPDLTIIAEPGVLGGELTLWLRAELSFCDFMVWNVPYVHCCILCL